MNLTAEDRFSQSLEVRSTSNENHNNSDFSLLDSDNDQQQQQQLTTDGISSFEYDGQLDQTKQFIWHIIKHDRDVIPVINNTNVKSFNFNIDNNISSGSGSVTGHNPLPVLVHRNQSNVHRDIDLIYMDAQTNFQAPFHSNVTLLFKHLNQLENQCRMRVLKSESKSQQQQQQRPLVLLVSHVNALDNQVLDVLKVYARRWSREPEKFGVSMVFAGNHIAYKFRDEKGARIWDYGTDLNTVMMASSASLEGGNVDDGADGGGSGGEYREWNK